MADVQSENLFLFNKKRFNKKASKCQFFLCKDKGGGEGGGRKVQNYFF